MGIGSKAGLEEAKRLRGSCVSHVVVTAAGLARVPNRGRVEKVVRAAWPSRVGIHRPARVMGVSSAQHDRARDGPTVDRGQPDTKCVAEGRREEAKPSNR